MDLPTQPAVKTDMAADGVQAANKNNREGMEKKIIKKHLSR